MMKRRRASEEQMWWQWHSELRKMPWKNFSGKGAALCEAVKSFSD
uniref:Uncharacterized protein n=1 Tax=Rhizophora mucronata TaxID=61149 RepID=A0A2P2PP35_RHIMU